VRASAAGFIGYRAIGQLLILAARSSGRLPAARAFAQIAGGGGYRALAIILPG
jgi:hypothetical protein